MNAKQAVEFVYRNGDGYAKAYAKVWLGTWGSVDAEWIENQLLYVISNFRSCRAEGHSNARRKLKEMLFTAMDGKVPE